jgi:hypothetical protein
MEEDMSIESAQEFIDRANQDQVIRKLARERFGEIVNVGREHGYDFELDEFDLAMRERKAQGGGPGGSQCSAGEKDGVGVCQCPSGSTGPAGRRDETVCQCGPSGSTGAAEIRDETVCQCGPSGSTGTADSEDAGVCQCAPPR